MRARFARLMAVVLVAGCGMLAAGHSRSALAADYTVQFGEVRGKPELLTPTRNVKLCLEKSGYSFGFQVTPGDSAAYRLKAVLHMPAAPKSIGSGLQSLNYGREAFDDQGTKTGASIVSYFFEEGDPLGNWSIDVIVNDVVVAAIGFTVAAAARCP